MKRDQHDLKNDLEAATDWNDLEVIQAALDNVKIHDSVEECVTLPLPDLMKGPKSVAERIMEEQGKRDPHSYRTVSRKISLLFGLTSFKKLSFVVQILPLPNFLLALGCST